MPRLHPVKPRVLIKFLEIRGFVKIRQKGSHIFFSHKDGRTTVVPFHRGEEIRPGLLRKILQDVRISPSEFLRSK